MRFLMPFFYPVTAAAVLTTLASGSKVKHECLAGMRQPEEVAGMTFSMTCSCGDTMTVKAGSREKAVRNMKSLLNEIKVYEHMAQKHSGDAVPTIEQVHAIIDQNLKTAL